MLTLNDLSVSFIQYGAGLKQTVIRPLSDIRLSVDAGEIVALVGASGSGKSLLAHAVLGILPENAKMTGTIMFKNEPLTKERQRALRGQLITLVPQSVTFLDPLMNVGNQVRKSLKNGKGRRRQKEMFHRFSLEKSVEKLYPFQLSGGMARRVLVSTALAGNPELIIADEPTPGLHASVVRDTLEYLRTLADRGCAVILITHDIGSVLGIADRIAVLYSGTLAEISPALDFRDDGKFLRHPYTKALWRALPENGFETIDGFQPLSGERIRGCVFGQRCPQKSVECEQEKPFLRDVREGKVRCCHAS